MVRDGLSLKVHRHKDSVSQANQSSGVSVAVNFGEFGKPIPVDVFVDKLCFVPIESICDKDRNVVLPCVARCCGEQNPVVDLGNLEKCLGPGSIADDSLFVKYKE